MCKGTSECEENEVSLEISAISQPLSVIMEIRLKNGRIEEKKN